MLQAKKDKDIVNRYITFCRLADKEKVKLIQHPHESVSEAFIDIFYEMISDDMLADKVGAQILRIPESVEDERYAFLYEEIYQAKRRILLAIAQKYRKELIAIYDDRNKRKFQADYIERKVSRIKNRQIKNTCLDLLSRLDTPDIHKMIKAQFLSATCATNQFVAFSLYINSSAKDKMKVLNDFEKVCQKNIVAYELFLSIVSRNESDDALQIIKRVETSPYFRIEMTNDQRALYGSYISNKRKSLLTEEGLKFTVNTMKELAFINEYTTVGMLENFSRIDKIEDKHQARAVKALLEIQRSLKKEDTPSVYNTIARILHNSPKAMKEYRKKNK
jgi:aminopeptidase N